MGRVIGVGTLDCMLVHKGDLMVGKEAYNGGTWVMEGGHGSAWVSMKAFSMVHEGEGGGNDIKGVSWGGSEGTVFKGDDGFVEVEADRHSRGKVALINEQVRAVAKEGEVAWGEGDGHACKGAGGLVVGDGEVGGAQSGG